MEIDELKEKKSNIDELMDIVSRAKNSKRNITKRQKDIRYVELS